MKQLYLSEDTNQDEACGVPLARYDCPDVSLMHAARGSKREEESNPDLV